VNELPESGLPDSGLPPGWNPDIQPPAGHQITLLSRPGCHLCADARAVIARVASELGVPWSERDITADPQDLADYGEMIPVTLIDGVQHDFWRVSEDRLRSALSR